MPATVKSAEEAIVPVAVRSFGKIFGYVALHYVISAVSVCGGGNAENIAFGKHRAICVNVSKAEAAV